MPCDHGSHGDEEISMGSVADFKEKPVIPAVSMIMLAFRTIIMVAFIAHAIVSVLGVLEVAESIAGVHYELGHLPVWLAVLAGVVGGTCGSESLFLEIPNSQQRFKEFGLFADNLLARLFKTRAFIRMCANGLDWLFNTKKASQWAEKHYPEVKAEEETGFHWEYLFTYSPLYFLFGNLIVRIIDSIQRKYFGKTPKQGEKSARDLEYEAYLEDLRSFPFWYLLIQPIAESFVCIFGGLAGASEGWMGISALLTYLTGTWGLPLVDLATGGLLTPSLIILGLIFSVSFTNNFFLGGLRAVDSMRDFARGGLRRNMHQLTDRRVLIQDSHSPYFKNMENQYAHYKEHNLFAAPESESTVKTRLFADNIKAGEIWYEVDAAKQAEQPVEIDGTPYRGLLKEANETQYIPIDEHGNTSAIFMVEGKPLLVDIVDANGVVQLDEKGTPKKRLYTIAPGDVVQIRIDDAGDFIICDHRGNPFLKDGQLLKWSEVSTATYEKGTPLFRSPGVPVLDHEGNLVFVKNKMPNIEKAGKEMVLHIPYKLSTELTTQSTRLEKGRAEYWLPKYLGIPALIIGVIVVGAVGVLGIATLLAGLPDLGLSSNLILAISVLSGAAFAIQNGTLQGTEAFELLRNIGVSLDQSAQKIANDERNTAKQTAKYLNLIDEADDKKENDFAEVKVKHYLLAVAYGLFDMVVSIFKGLVMGFKPLFTFLKTAPVTWYHRVRHWYNPAYVIPGSYPDVQLARLAWRIVLQPLKLLVGFFGPLAHGAEAFRGVFEGAPKLILLFMIGSAALAVGAAVIWTPPGWAIGLLLALAIAGALVVGMQNKSLEVRAAYDAIDAAEDALAEGRFLRNIAAPEIRKFCSSAADGFKTIGRGIANFFRKKENKKEAPMPADPTEAYLCSAKEMTSDSKVTPPVEPAGVEVVADEALLLGEKKSTSSLQERLSAQFCPSGKSKWLPENAAADQKIKLNVTSYEETLKQKRAAPAA